MDLLQQPEASVVIIANLYLFYCVPAPLHQFSLCTKNDTPATFEHDHPLFKMTSTSALTCLRFGADQNLTGFLLIFLSFCLFFFSFHPQETSFCFSHLICPADLSDVSPYFWSAGNSQEAAADQCHGAVRVNIAVMQRSQLGPLKLRTCSFPYPHAKRENIPESICLNTYFRFDGSLSKPRVNFMKLLGLHEYRLIRKFLMASS